MQYIVFGFVLLLILGGLVFTYIYLVRRDKKAMDQAHQSLVAVKEEDSKEENSAENNKQKLSAGLEIYDLTKKSVDENKKKKYDAKLEEFIKNIEEETEDEDFFDQMFNSDDDEKEDIAFKKFKSERRQRRAARKINTSVEDEEKYTLADFKRDFNAGIDINVIMNRMSPELREVVLTKILEKKDFDF